MYTKIFVIRWHEIDANGHMRNTAYLDRAVDVRLTFFVEHGFSIADFSRLKFGPVVLRDEMEYYKEVRLMQEIRVSFSLKAMSPDGSRFQFQNEYFRSDGKLCARLTTSGGWLDLDSRKIVAPPENLLKALNRLPKSKDFITLEV